MITDKPSAGRWGGFTIVFHESGGSKNNLRLIKIADRHGLFLYIVDTWQHYYNTWF